jgi:predicted permease
MTATIDGVVFAFTTAATLVACLLFGLAPSLSAGRVDPIGSLRLAGRGRRSQRRFGLTEPFVVAQVAMSLALVLTATLLVRTLLNAQQHPYGFDQDNVLLVQINPRSAGYQSATVGDLYRRIHDRMASLPGVERVSFARYAPFSGSSSSSTATVDGYQPAPGEKISLETILVGPNYPQTIGMPLVAGRAFTFDDSAGAPRVAMVNEAFTRRFFPRSSPIGYVVDFGSRDDRRHEIVGVLKDAHFRNIREAVIPGVFLPMLQEPTGRILDAEFELRARGDAGPLAGLVREAIVAVDPKVSVGRTRTLRAQVLSTFGRERTAAGFIVAFAGLALFVASIGLYGVVSHGLARRTNEIGVRLALGAARVDVVQLIARETMLRLGLGLVIGFLLTQAGGRFLAGQLFGVTPNDITSAVIAALVLSAVVALTAVRPLMRAMRVDPVVALRAE